MDFIGYEIERERKFIVPNDQWKQHADLNRSENITQGYIEDYPVKLMVITDEETGHKKAFATFKHKNGGGPPIQWEFRIPPEHAQAMIDAIGDPLNDVEKVVERRRCTGPDKVEIQHLSQVNIKSKLITVRVRLSERASDGQQKAIFTIKGRREVKDNYITRPQLECEIPFGEGQRIMDEVCKRKIKKTRHYVTWPKEPPHKIWEIDAFTEPKCQGLKIAEVEVQDPNERFELPPFVAKKNEVTGDDRYATKHLACHDAKSLKFLKTAIQEAAKGPGKSG